MGQEQGFFRSLDFKSPFEERQDKEKQEEKKKKKRTLQVTLQEPKTTPNTKHACNTSIGEAEVEVGEGHKFKATLVYTARSKPTRPSQNINLREKALIGKKKKGC